MVCLIISSYEVYKVTWGKLREWGNSVKSTSEIYSFTSTLAIEMYLGKHDAYSILNTSQARWATAILPCCDREATSGGGTKYPCKNFPVNIDVDLYTLRLLILPKTCSKVRNSVFATHCTANTLDVVHTGGHAVAINFIWIHWVTPSTIFLPIVRIYK